MTPAIETTDEPGLRPAGKLVVIALWMMPAVTACNLPGLPAESADATGPRDIPRQEVGTTDIRPDARIICEPGSRVCGPYGVRKCVAGGTKIRDVPCGEGELCEAGECQSVVNECNTDLPFHVSASSLTFQSDDQLRADSAPLRVANCTSAEIVLQSISLHQRSRDRRPEMFPDDIDAFSIRNPSTFESLRMPSNNQVQITLDYTPKTGFFLDTKTQLQLLVRGSRLYSAEIPVRRHIHCVSVAPTLDLGVWSGGEGTSTQIPVTNCGTIPAKVTAPQVEGVHLHEDPRTRRLLPGNTEHFAFEVHADHPGRFATSLPFTSRPVAESTDHDTETTTARLIGRAAPTYVSGFRDFPPLQFRPPTSETWTSVDKTDPRTTIVPGNTIDLRAAPEAKAGLEQILLARSPARSTARLRAAPAAEHLVFEPDVPGTYTIAYRGISESGRLSNHPKFLRIVAEPEAPLYVELSWTTHRDPIPGDEGYGRGVDLNLHVNPIEAGETGPWDDPASDCFLKGDRGSRLCQQGEGRVRKISASGGGVEAISFESVGGLNFGIAVRSWNTYGFPGADAELRIYVDGKQLELTESPLSQQFGASAGTVWDVGTWDPNGRQFEFLDRIQKEFGRKK